MQEDYFLKCRVYAWFAWLAMAVFISAGWIVMVVNHRMWWLSVLLGITGLSLSAVAATLHIRSFMVRVCALVRAASDRELPRDGGLRPVG